MKTIYRLKIILFLAVSFNNHAQNSGGSSEYIYFHRVTEPNEKAFSVLVPKGWQTEGGIFRLDPTVSGGAGNAIAAKYDFAVFNNTSKDVQIRWLPDYLFFDMRNTPAAGFFAEGANYNGMQVKHKTNALNFTMQVVIPFAHPNISKVQKTDAKALPGLAKAYSDLASQTPLLTMTYDAAQVNIEYTENGKTYEEIIITIVEDWGQMGAGMWGNKGCLFIRAPKHELKKWAPMLETIHTSVKIDINWIMREMKSQTGNATTYRKVQKTAQEIDREITAHRQQTNAEIQNDMYLTLTDQEDYINPFTNEVEIGTNQWDHRWQNDLGEIIYCNDENFNPNNHPDLQVSGFKRSRIRKR